METGMVVPTWNYVVVHAHGELRAIEDLNWLRNLVDRLTTTHEVDRQEPWKMSDAHRAILYRIRSCDRLDTDSIIDGFTKSHQEIGKPYGVFGE
jgi:predicted FMN-binding regulatory protein PaiB